MPNENNVHEFKIIDKYFKPLAKAADGALGLTDDAAILDIPKGQQLVVSTDAIVEGVHFLAAQSPADIAHKLVGVNLSDLAAMGAQPHAVFLAAQFPKQADDAWLSAFAAGLGDALTPSGATLMGGDTVRTPGPLSLTLTVLGLVPEKRALTRSGARVGDAIYVSGLIGDGALGLLCATGKCPDNAYLVNCYARPQPRWELGLALVAQGIASSCIDISDGLMADLKHICACSNVSGVVQAAQIPRSQAAQQLIAAQPDLDQLVLTGGDDYELLFTARPAHEAVLKALSAKLGLAITRIGHVETGSGTVTALDSLGRSIDIGTGGFEHL